MNNLQMSEESIYSISKPDKAANILKIINKYLRNKGKQTSQCVITDATACVGGDTIHFSKVFKYVNAFEIKSEHCRMLKHNLKLYSRDNVNVICEDYVKSKHTVQQDIVYIDPPWGGPSYKRKNSVQLKLSNIPIYKIIDAIINDTLMIVLKTPINFDVQSLMKISKCNVQIKSIHIYNLENMLIIVILPQHDMQNTK